VGITRGFMKTPGFRPSHSLNLDRFSVWFLNPGGS
jgi:hypothetical protein